MKKSNEYEIYQILLPTASHTGNHLECFKEKFLENQGVERVQNL